MSESKDVLRGLTLKVYRFILKHDGPVGIREVQRALNLSSPTLALYHIDKLEEAGLVKTSYKPGVRGVKKVCSTDVKEVRLILK